MPAVRQFTMQDQDGFAALTGDANPMHMDPIAARRTAAAQPAVHGIHNLLWCLNEISSAGSYTQLTSLRVNFDRFVTVGEPVTMHIVKHDETVLKAEVRNRFATVLTMLLGFGTKLTEAGFVSDGPLFAQDTAQELRIEEMAGQSGRITNATTPAEMAAAFPAAASLLGADRLAGLGAMTRLVGMAVPGLHSIFTGLSLKVTSESADDILHYRVKTCDTTHRRIVQEVSGCGWTGTITCSARQKPVAQRSLASLAGIIAPDRFAGTTALIIGGSRGLGELTAKLLAAGGANLMITYAQGRADAERLGDDISASGGVARIMRYDVLADPAPQLVALPAVPTQLYYFATPPIGTRQTSDFFDLDRFQRFTAYYLQDFARLVAALQLRQPDGLTTLYPSTSFIDDRPEGMTEYAMAKAAGEIMCADLMAALPRLRIITARLPRLPTDQTAGLRNIEAIDSVASLLPCLLAMHGQNDRQEA
jgi:hypothetical protein